MYQETARAVRATAPPSYPAAGGADSPRPMSSPSLLVVGAGGLVGSHVAALGVPALDRTACDVTSAVHRQRALREHRPEAVIYCAAYASVDGCETDPESWEVNGHAPAAWAREVPLWYVSTNYVFSGPGPHWPDAPTAPLQAYGHQKVRAEGEVLAAGGHVVRTGWVFGQGGRNFLSTLPDQLRRGPVRAYGGVPIQPTWAGDLARLLITLPPGLSHAIGREQTSFAGAARTVATALGLEGRVREVPGPAGELAADRPRDARLHPATLPGWSERWNKLLADTIPPNRAD
jgi:dTDP-4-dehydrorhamnose reductase